MKTAYNLLVVVCISWFSSGGCADSTPDGEKPEIEPAPQTQVLRYGAEDIAALPADEFLRLDLNVENTVYILTYSDPAALARVLVTRGNDQFTLADQPPETVGGPAGAQGDGLKQVLLSGSDPQPNLEEEPPPIESCTCPCCLTTGGKLYCC